MAGKIPTSKEYENFYKRWKQLLDAKCPLPPKEAEIQRRLAIGLGAESVLETSITLHRTYGTPYIPGSALKGLAAHYARNYLKGDKWDKDKEAYITLFGDTDSAGYITFYDALYVPKTGYKKNGKPQALWPDIITVHHPEYYQGKDSPPADWDNPTPIPFLSATGKYLIALSGPKEWVKTAFKILALALKELGIGAKTSSGYGRMLLGEESQKAQEPTETYALVKHRLLKKETPPPGRFRGTVVKVKGSYGFINPAKGGGERFVHQSKIREGNQQLVNGQIVEYRIGDDGKAKEVDILLEP